MVEGFSQLFCSPASGWASQLRPSHPGPTISIDLYASSPELQYPRRSTTVWLVMKSVPTTRPIYSGTAHMGAHERRARPVTGGTGQPLIKRELIRADSSDNLRATMYWRCAAFAIRRRWRHSRPAAIFPNTAAARGSIASSAMARTRSARPRAISASRRIAQAVTGLSTYPVFRVRFRRRSRCWMT